MNEEFERMKKAINALPEDMQKDAMMTIIEKLFNLVEETVHKPFDMIKETLPVFISLISQFDEKDIQLAIYMANPRNQLKNFYIKGFKKTLVTAKKKKIEKITGVKIRDAFDWMKEKHVIP